MIKVSITMLLTPLPNKKKMKLNKKQKKEKNKNKDNCEIPQENIIYSIGLLGAKGVGKSKFINLCNAGNIETCTIKVHSLRKVLIYYYFKVF